MVAGPDKVDTYSEARQALRRPEYFETRKWDDQQLRAVRAGASPLILEFERRFIAKLRKVGIPMFAHCVMRTAAMQDAIYREGHSRAKAGESPHQHGYAVDMIHSVYGWQVPLSPAESRPGAKCWDIIGALGKETAASAQIDIEWGGDWKFYDPAHWQIRDWRTLAGL